MSLESDLRELFQRRQEEIRAPALLPRTTRRRVVGVKIAYIAGVITAVLLVGASAISIASRVVQDHGSVRPGGSPNPTQSEVSRPLESQVQGVYTHDFGTSANYPSGVWHLTLRSSSYVYEDSNTVLGQGRLRQAGDRLLLDRDSSCGRLTAIYKFKLLPSKIVFTPIGDQDQCTTRATLFARVKWERP